MIERTGWFKLHPSRNLSLSKRALLELETYLRETFEEQDDDRDPRDRPYMECRQCSGIVTSVSRFYSNLRPAN